jgi:hypothetical protein
MFASAFSNSKTFLSYLKVPVKSNEVGTYTLAASTHLTTLPSPSYLEAGDLKHVRRSKEKMLNLTLGVTRNLRFEPLIDGTVTSKILNLQFVVTTPPELFYRNLKYDEFDVFEMSLSATLTKRV